jgi:hypothetical protein
MESSVSPPGLGSARNCPSESRSQTWQGAGCRVQGPGSRVQGPGFRVQGPGFRVQGSGFRVQGSGFRVQGPGFRVQGPGFRVQGSGFRVQAPPETAPANPGPRTAVWAWGLIVYGLVFTGLEFGGYLDLCERVCASVGGRVRESVGGCVGKSVGGCVQESVGGLGLRQELPKRIQDPDLRYGLQGSGVRHVRPATWRAGCRVQGAGCRVQGSWVQGSGFRLRQELPEGVQEPDLRYGLRGL